MKRGSADFDLPIRLARARRFSKSSLSPTAERVVGRDDHDGVGRCAHREEADESPSAWARAVKGLTIDGTSSGASSSRSTPTDPTLGVRFGMTGVLLLDGDAGVEGLFYGPHLSTRSGCVAGSNLTTVESSSFTIRDASRDSRSIPTSASSDPTRSR